MEKLPVHQRVTCAEILSQFRIKTFELCKSSSCYLWFFLVCAAAKVHLITGHEVPKGAYRYSSAHSLTSALDGGRCSTPRSGRFTPGKVPVPLVWEAGWPPAPVWTGAENLAPTGIRSPDRPARSESLYRLNYSGHDLYRSHTLNQTTPKTTALLEPAVHTCYPHHQTKRCIIIVILWPHQSWFMNKIINSGRSVKSPWWWQHYKRLTKHNFQKRMPPTEKCNIWRWCTFSCKHGTRTENLF